MPVTITGLDTVTARVAAMAQAATGLGRSTVQVAADAPHARFVEDGTRPHPIDPRPRQTPTGRPPELFWEGAAHPVRHVDHPGTTANPFMERALAEGAPIATELLAAALVGIGDGEPPSVAAAALAEAGQRLAQIAQQMAPVGTGPGAGNLRASIHEIVVSRL